MKLKAEKKKGPNKSDLFSLILAERTGLAHILRAAESLASDSLRARNRVSRRGDPLVPKNKKGPINRTFFI
jgi:hypothetical protein